MAAMDTLFFEFALLLSVLLFIIEFYTDRETVEEQEMEASKRN